MDKTVNWKAVEGIEKQPIRLSSTWHASHASFFQPSKNIQETQRYHVTSWRKKEADRGHCVANTSFPEASLQISNAQPRSSILNKLASVN